MARLIDEDEFMKEIRKWLGNETDFRSLQEIIAGMPTIDPVKHGKWIKDKDRDMLRCSVCKNFCVENWYYWLRYCPDCGARMDGE